MDKYVDGFLIPVPRDKLDEYKKMSRVSADVWMDHGALEYVECLADDVQPGKVTSFPQAVDLQEGETVIFSFIVYRDREHRDAVNKLAMEDPRFDDFPMEAMPFDGKRLIWGGFQPMIWRHAGD